MRKTYLQPMFRVVRVRPAALICDSQRITNPDRGFTYGGVDEDGDLEPESRSMHRHRSVWDDDSD